MKIGALSVVVFDNVFGTSIPMRTSREAIEDQQDNRRFYQMQTMMFHHNPTWGILKYSAYGCNCHYMVGDRPMSTPGYGQAIDDLDAVCKDHKSCLNCAEAEYGEECINEFTRYDFDIVAADGIVCMDAAGSCGRALCECDKKFAAEHYQYHEVYDNVFNNVYAGFPYQDVCPTMCSRNVMDVAATSIYSSHVFDGSYVSNHELYNGRKCYEHTANSNYLIQWEVDLFGGAWVITDGIDPKFYSTDNIPCPDLADWVYLPNGAETIELAMVNATQVTFGGTTPAEKLEARPEVDEQCCQSINQDSAMTPYNTVTHVCCDNGLSALSVDVC